MAGDNPQIDRLADDICDGAEEFAAWSGFKLRAVYHMVRNNQIPYTKVGNKLIFRKSECARRLSGEQIAA